MEKGEKFQREKIGKPGYINENCWLVKTLNYTPYKRCQYCELKFRKCLFLHYQIISLILILFFLTLSFLIKGKTSELVITSVFTLVIVYGYFFNKSTDKIIRANFAQRKAKEALEELTEKLQEKVDEQTREIKGAYKKVEKAYEVEKHAHKELKRLDEAKSQFMLATQHHLRTPLSSMQGYLGLISEGLYGKVPKKLKEVLQKFQTSTRSEIKIVNELLDISQFQLGKEVVFLRPNIKIEPILKEIIEELKLEAESKGIYLRLEKPAEKVPEIKAAPSKLKVALTNVIDNAIKYTKQGGVTMSLKIKDLRLQIIVKDTGLGIPKEELPFLFTRTFERGEGAKRAYGPGKGIGLYLTANIIKAHQGRIWAESEGANKGSTFYVELPIIYEKDSSSN